MSLIEIITHGVAALSAGSLVGGLAAWGRARERRLTETARLDVHVTREREETGRFERAELREAHAAFNAQLMARNESLQSQLLESGTKCARELDEVREAHARELAELRAAHAQELAAARSALEYTQAENAVLRVADAQKTEALKATHAKLAHVEEDHDVLQRRLDEQRAEVKRLQEIVARLLDEKLSDPS